MIFALFLSFFLFFVYAEMTTRVDIVNAQPKNAKVTTAHKYDAMVTLSIENADGTLTPSGWSTRKENKGDGRPFSFQPGVNLITGWTKGVLEMREGERAHIHVPYTEGYGTKEQGSKGGAWYIPASSNLHFDIEILGKSGKKGPEAEL
jgi:hypothetical protein